MRIDYTYLKHFWQDFSMDDVYFIIYHIMNHIRSNGPFTGEAVWFVNFVNGITTGSIHCNSTFFPFVINKCSLGWLYLFSIVAVITIYHKYSTIKKNTDQYLSPVG